MYCGLFFCFQTSKAEDQGSECSEGESVEVSISSGGIGCGGAICVLLPRI